MKFKEKSRPSISSYQYLEEEKSWKWTKGKIAAISILGLLILGMFFSEVILYKPYEAPADDLNNIQDYRSVKDQDDWTYLLEDDPELEKDTLQEAETFYLPPPESAGNDSRVNTGSNRPLNSPARNRPVSSTASSTRPELRISEDGEIIEVPANQAERSQTNFTGNTESADNSSIEEEFYTEVTVTGTITSASDGTAISGVIITIKGTPMSTATDPNGKYAITVPGNPEFRTLSFSYRGNISERVVQPETRVINLRF